MFNRIDDCLHCLDLLMRNEYGEVSQQVGVRFAQSGVIPRFAETDCQRLLELLPIDGNALAASIQCVGERLVRHAESLRFTSMDEQARALVIGDAGPPFGYDGPGATAAEADADNRTPGQFPNSS